MNTEVMTARWCWLQDMEMLTFDATPQLPRNIEEISEYPQSNQELPELPRVFIPKYLQALAT